MCNRILFVPLFFYINVPLVISRNATYNSTILSTEPLREVSESEDAVWCKFQPNGFDCNDNGRFRQYYYFDTKLEDCKLFSFGSCTHDQNKFNTLKECRENCLDAGVRDIFGKISSRIYCKFQPEFGLCNEYYPKFYFDMSTRTCRGFSYSGCGGNLNRFATAQLCSTICGNLMENTTKE